MTFVLLGAPRTKKNHSRIVWAGKSPRLLPSAEFVQWNQSAQLQLAMVRAKSSVKFPITSQVNCRALFYRETDTGDLCNYFQALADALQEAGIIENDRQICGWDGSRPRKDAQNPRIEVELAELGAAG